MKVKFVPQNVEFEIRPGQSVMHLAEDHGLYIKSVCRGVPSCAECRIKIKEGEANVFPPAASELALIGTGWFIDRRRLSCQLQCIGDVTIDMTEQIAKKEGLSTGVVGGRKTKKSASVGDRVEEEITIRTESPESETSGPSRPSSQGPSQPSGRPQPKGRDGGRDGGRDRKGPRPNRS